MGAGYRERTPVEITIETIVRDVQSYAPDAEVDLLMQAYLIAAHAHRDQKRKTGEPYLTHPVAVANILVEMGMDVDTVATALLHDSLEDSPLTKEELASDVGDVVAELVDGVTKIGKLKFRSKEELQAENFRKMMLAMSRDLRVILVKLADRLHNMRTLDGHTRAKQIAIARETREVYAPLANRLGLSQLKAELETLCFRYLEPEDYERVVGYLRDTQADRESYIERICAMLKAELVKHDIEGEVSGRAKAPYSVYQKMKAQGLAVADVPDLLAFRLIVPDLTHCYALLGFLHAEYAPLPGRIKDYIARPKMNGYQSLHTTVVGPEDKRIEVQIRTAEMHDVAEQGIAAHWQYKEGHLALDPAEVLDIAKMRDAVVVASESEDADEFMETMKASLYSDHVFVTTPRGEVKKFPRGATPLDFAYSIHSDVGDSCVGANVSGRMVSLDYTLRSGDTVEILTKPNQHPRRHWLQIAKTSRAISKIRRYLRKQEEHSAKRVGRGILNNELQRVGWSVERAKTEGRLTDYLKQRGVADLEPVWIEIAMGNRPVGEVAKAVLPEKAWFSKQEEASRSAIGHILQRFTRPSKTARTPVLISGEDDMLVTFAGCCSPVPGEPVKGFITRGRGITVHQRDCRQLKNMAPERRISVQWDEEVDARHSNSLSIYCQNKPGMLSQIHHGV